MLSLLTSASLGVAKTEHLKERGSTATDGDSYETYAQVDAFCGLKQDGRACKYSDADVQALNSIVLLLRANLVCIFAGELSAQDRYGKNLL
jgi:hypothetical protein